MPEGIEDQPPQPPAREEGRPALTYESDLTQQQKRLKDLFFQSFRFSQGAQGLQGNMLKWLVAKGYFDGIDIPETPPAYMQKIVVPKKHPPMLHDTEKLNAINDAWAELYHVKHLKEPLSIEELPASILASMIERDSAYQKHKRQNRPTSEDIEPDSINDPHASFVRRYVINAHPTGSDAFNELHKELAQVLTRYRHALPTDPEDIKSTQSKLDYLAKGWETNHPGHTFFSR